VVVSRPVYISDRSVPLTSPTDHKLAIGFIVLIALAIALAIIFLIVVAGILAERYRRKRDGYVAAPQNMPVDKNINMSRLPPEHLFGSGAPL
jgi:hypothetical protein